jgi:hypothetical protein
VPHRTAFFCGFFFFIICKASAQEFSAQITIDRSQITNVGIDWLEQAIPLISSYYNDRKWTTLTFEEYERVQVQFKLIFNSIDANNNAAAQFVVSSTRPIYGTTQQTSVLNLIDDSWQFNFARNRNLLFDEQSYDAFATTLNFYAYILLGMDADTFSPLGGTPFFEKAQQIANVAQSAGIGWGRDGRRRNRTYLIQYLLDPQLSGIRRAIYTYHREGLDLFTREPDKARRNVLEALKSIRETQRKTTEQYLMMLFFNTKFREIVRIFEDADPLLKQETYALLTELDPSHLTEYDKLKN